MGALSYFVNLEQSLYPLSSEDTEGRTATGAAQRRPCASDMGSVSCAFNRSQNAVPWYGRLGLYNGIEFFPVGGNYSNYVLCTFSVAKISLRSGAEKEQEDGVRRDLPFFLDSCLLSHPFPNQGNFVLFFFHGFPPKSVFSYLCLAGYALRREAHRMASLLLSRTNFYYCFSVLDVW